MFALLPIEVISGYLYHLTSAIVESFRLESGEDAPELLKVITDPFTKLIIEVSSFSLQGSCLLGSVTANQNARNMVGGSHSLLCVLGVKLISRWILLFISIS